MITILFRTNEDNLPSTLCLDTAVSVYMSADNRIIIETTGDDYISAKTITAADFEVLIRAAFMGGSIDLSDNERFGLFDFYESYEDEDAEDMDSEV